MKHLDRGNIRKGKSPIQSFIYEKHNFDRPPEDISKIGLSEQDKVVFDIQNQSKENQKVFSEIERLISNVNTFNFHDNISRIHELIKIYGESVVDDLFKSLQEDGKKALTEKLKLSTPLFDYLQKDKEKQQTDDSSTGKSESSLSFSSDGKISVKISILISFIAFLGSWIPAAITYYGEDAIKESQSLKHIEENKKAIDAIVIAVAKLESEIRNIDRGLSAYQEEASRISTNQSKIVIEIEKLNKAIYDENKTSK